MEKQATIDQSTIDQPGTYDQIRRRHRSVQRYCAAKGWNKVVFYQAVAGNRGTSGRYCLSREILETLDREGLLVFKDVVNG